MSSVKGKDSIKKLIDNGDLVIRPLLDEAQITEVGIDFRLGVNFLVSVLGREPLISTSLNEEYGESKISMHAFQETRRQLGETFILHPHQTVLATSLEYVKLPDNILLSLTMRSSYSRLGLTLSTISQPGYCGCISLELTNMNRTPISLTVGARLLQGILFETDHPTNYFRSTRKYTCNVRPEPSAAINDTDLVVLNRLWKLNNHR